MSSNKIIGDQYYKDYAKEAGMNVENAVKGGLLSDFSKVFPINDPNKSKLNKKVAAFYEHTANYKLEVWSQWYSPISFFAKILIKKVSPLINQLNIPLHPLETCRGMSNEVIHLKDANGNIIHACWLRKSILSGKVVYAGFYSGIEIDSKPLVRVVFPLPDGNVTVLLRAFVQDDGSIKLISDGREIGDAGYYRLRKKNSDSVKIKYIPLKESIHVYEDNEGTLRTEHVFYFWRTKILHLHYKIIPLN